jgi:V/A-type H+-transporting ATPase subunit I
MIVQMSRIIVLGPRRLLGAVLDEVQRLGSLHVDRIESDEAPPAPATDEQEAQRQRLERMLAQVDGLLTLLPPVDGAGSVSADVGSPEEVEAELAALERQVRDLTRARLELEEERTLIDTYAGAVRALSPLLGALQGSARLESLGFLVNTTDLKVVAALRSELVKATGGRVEVVSRAVDDRRLGVVVAFRREDGDAVRAVLTRAGITELRLPARFAGGGVADAVALMERRRQEIPQDLERVDRQLVDLAGRVRPRLEALRAALADRVAQLTVLQDLGATRYTFILHGWAPSRAAGQIRAVLLSRFGPDVVVFDSPADPHHEPERVPVLLDNHPWIRPFQRLLALFQPPRYGSWDPSPVVAVTFPLFVGLVIGDVGYGALLFLLGWKLRSLARAGRTLELRLLNLRFPPSLLQDASFLIRVCAAWIMVFGAIYAEAFGNLPELLWHVRPLFNRVEDTGRYFLFIIAAGIAMIFLGLAVHLVQALRHRHLEGAFEAGVIMLGTAGLLLFLGARGAMLPASLDVAGLGMFGAAIALAGASLAVERNVIRRFLWLLESTTAFGHILSHARLMAFGLAAAALAMAANELGRQAGALGRVAAVLVGALFQALFFVFTIFGHVIQPARLHWVEFFSKFKFHEETGRAYRPFRKAAVPGRR